MWLVGGSSVLLLIWPTLLFSKLLNLCNESFNRFRNLGTYRHTHTYSPPNSNMIINFNFPAGYSPIPIGHKTDYLNFSFLSVVNWSFDMILSSSSSLFPSLLCLACPKISFILVSFDMRDWESGERGGSFRCQTISADQTIFVCVRVLLRDFMPWSYAFCQQYFVMASGTHFECETLNKKSSNRMKEWGREGGRERGPKVFIC